MDTQARKKSTGQLIGLVAALAVLLCFFLPWIEITAPSVAKCRLACLSGEQGTLV